MTILEIMNSLRATTSRNEKQAILEANKDHPLLFPILNVASNPFVTLYHKSLPTKAPAFQDQEMQKSFDTSLDQSIEYIDASHEANLAAGEFIGMVIKKITSPNSTRDNITSLLFALGYVLSHKNIDPEYKKTVNAMLAGDLNIGVSVSTINKVFRNSIPVFEFNKAEEVAHLDNIVYPARADLKLDGQAAFASVSRSGEVIIRSSSGRVYEKLPTITKDVEELARSSLMSHFYDGFTLCAELVAHDKDGKRNTRGESNGLAAKARTGSISDEDEVRMRLYVYDVLRSANQLAEGIDPRPLEDRLVDLPLSDPHSAIIPCPHEIVNSKDELMSLFDAVVKEGEEGLIAKNLKSYYVCERTKDWVKLKAEKQADVRITDVKKHKKKDDQIGSLYIESEDGKVVGSVGTKLSEHQRKTLYKTHEKGKLIGSIATIVFHKITSSKSKKTCAFYLPRFIEIRDDKNEADSFEKLMDM